MIESPTINSVHGRIRSITGTDPAANVEISEAVPARRRWRLMSIRIQLITDVNVADRQLIFIINDGSYTPFVMTLATIQAASLTYTYYLSLFHSAEVKTLTNIIVPIPNLILPADFIIETSTINLQATDNYGAPQMLVEEWIDP